MASPQVPEVTIPGDTPDKDQDKVATPPRQAFRKRHGNAVPSFFPPREFDLMLTKLASLHFQEIEALKRREQELEDQLRKQQARRVNHDDCNVIAMLPLSCLKAQPEIAEETSFWDSSAHSKAEDQVLVASVSESGEGFSGETAEDAWKAIEAKVPDEGTCSTVSTASPCPEGFQQGSHQKLAATGSNELRISTSILKEELRRHQGRSSKMISTSLQGDCSEGFSIRSLVSAPLFHALGAIMIIFNSVLVGLDIEWATSHTEANAMLDLASTACTIYFTAELALRMHALRCDFFMDPECRTWNVFDLILVLLGLVEETAGRLLLQGGAMGSIKTLRILRILRIFRVFRIFRQLGCLALMIIESVKSLFWAMVMLALISYVFAVVLTSQTSAWLAMQTGTFGIDVHENLPSHADPAVTSVRSLYGSLGRTTYTLSQTVLGGVSWHEVCDPLFNVSWLSVSSLLVYIAFNLLAVLNVITAVFVDQAFRSTEKERCDVIQKEMDKQEEEFHQIRDFFLAIDEDGSGEISPAELQDFLSDPTTCAYFRALGFHIHDPSRFVDIFDVDNSGTISFEEFLEGCMKYKGVAQAVEVHGIARRCDAIEAHLQSLITLHQN